jgi:SCY1-like protein 2
LATEQLSVRVNSLVCLGKMTAVMDKWLVQDLLMPFLERVPAREPGVLMAMLGIFNEVYI